jgi:type I restriction enzyme S subunit
MSEVVVNMLPESWEMTTLSKVTLPIEKVKPANEPSKEILYLDIGGVDKATNTVVDYKIYLGKDAPSRAQQAIKKGDVAFASVRPYLRNIAVVPNSLDNQVGSTGFCFLRAADGIDSKYIYYWVISNTFINDITKYQKGSSYPAVTNKQILERRIPLAPPEQQKRIVAKIEELFSHIDAGTAALKKAKQLLKQYRQSVLKAAVTGELTKQWREDRLKDDVQGSTSAAGAGSAGAAKLEPASQLLERILQERRQKWEAQQLEQFKAKGKVPKDDGWKGKYKEPENVEIEDKLVELPSCWQWVCLDSLIVDGPKNGIYLPKTKYGSGIPIIRIDDFQDGYIRPYEKLQKVQATEVEVTVYQVSLKSLIINRVNSLTHLGKCLIIKDEYIPCLFESNMMKADMVSQVKVEYLDYYIQSQFGRSRLIKNAKWAVNQASINQQDVKSMEITLPPYEEQHEIIRVVATNLDSITRLEADIDVQLKKAGKNKQSILASAFSGKLLHE